MTTILFIRAYWKYLAGIALLILAMYQINSYLDSVYLKGRSSGISDTNKEWKEKYDRDIGILNTRIASIEDAAKVNAQAAQTELKSANGKIISLQEELKKQRSKYDSYVYNQNGNVVCKTDSPIFLGPAFSVEWNKLNAQIVK